MNNEEKIISLLETLVTDVAELKRGQTRLEERMSNLEAAVARLEERMSNLEAAVACLEVRMAKLEETTASIGADVIIIKVNVGDIKYALNEAFRDIYLTEDKIVQHENKRHLAGKAV